MVGECGIYEIVNLSTGSRYIGSAVSFRKRWHVHRHHLRKGTHHSEALQRAWAKHGESNFDFRVIEECPREELLRLEQGYLDRFQPRYNTARTVGGGALGVMSEEARERLRERNRARAGVKMSDAHRLAISQATTGRTAHNKGKRQSPEWVAKRVKAHVGAKRSPETRAKISAKAKTRNRKK